MNFFRFLLDFLLSLHLFVITFTKIFHVSHNNISNDSPDCGNLNQPCYSVPYALKMAGNDSDESFTIVALGCCYIFSINETIGISTVGNSLEMTSYCKDTKCFERRQRAEI